jgi:hypothetical protein
MAPFGEPVLEGSALCAGDATEPSGYKQCVWLLHGSSNTFERYRVADNEWDPMEDLPGDPTGSGGALAYVPDPFAYPWPSGLVFALKGGNTPDFLVYCPGNNTWVPLEPAPQNVIAGGALCYGGEDMVGGLRCAILYAFTGQSDQDRGGFYRYVFPEVPYDPDGGHWEPLVPVPHAVSPGAALAWIRLSNSELSSWALTAFTGGATNTDFWWYARPPGGGPPSWYIRDITTWPQHEGACMTSLTCGNGDPCVAMLYGGDQVEPAADSWCDFYYPFRAPRFIRQDDTPLEVAAGSALAYVFGGTTVLSAVYAEFGRQEEPNRTFWRLPVPASSGGQSSGNVALTANRVQVLAGMNQSRFIVSCQPGPVSMKVFNSAGAVVATLRASANAGRAEFVWPHAGVPSGVYLYAVSCTSGLLTGKVVVMK